LRGTWKWVAVAAVVAVPAAAAPQARAAPGKVRIAVLSTRADLVSGHDALVRVSFSRARDVRGARLTAGRRSVRRAFRRTGKRQLVGLVGGLKRGWNVLTVRLRNGRGARITLTSHAIGGPVFAGPQLKPWRCQATARDAQCNEAPSFTYLYKSTSPAKQGLQPYDPATPPSDVAMTTTDRGVRVPFIVRVETGYIDRDQYKVAALFQPGKRWTPVRPQRQYNRKLLITHGASCGVEYQPAEAPGVTTGAAENALARGWVTMSHALNNSGHNCNIALQAEALLMTKEHVIERYGTVRYTIGTGCSGGSLAIQWVANAYPGIYQGILPSCSFPDAWSTATQFLDYHNTLAYFTDPTKWGVGVVWTPTQMADVQGHISIVNAKVSDSAQFHVVVPTDPCGGVTDAERYHPQTNPGGVRCTITDAAINVFGPRPRAAWTAQEQQIGRGFAGIPVDNVGVQYGLDALRKGRITPAQFADLNAKVGGLTVADIAITPNRLAADGHALRNAYRSGMINEANNLDRTAIIDCRGPDEGLFHDAYRAFAMRARLGREHGHHRNHVIWEGPVTIRADVQCEVNSFLAMDRWLAAVERDRSSRSLARKVARNRPSDITDRCYDGAGHKLTDDLCGQAVVRTYGTPRTVAGDALTTDTNKCRLKPLRRSDYSVTFTDAQWAALERAFPAGVCDFSRPGVAQQPAIAWQTYQRPDGKVIYGGRPVGAAQKSRALR
jgi:Tannase-like family of unknown function (DUF6351)